MMISQDIRLLENMREAVLSYRSGTLDLGFLASKLLEFRDGLQFSDHPWCHEITQQVATLDSASTFVPKDDGETQQLQDAIAGALEAILSLIEDKLASGY